jgi:tetratricopeptide (TPR) repeat protein
LYKLFEQDFKVGYNILSMETIDFTDFIERFNSGEMNEAEKLWFLKELDGNESLKKEVALSKKTDEVLEKQDVISLRNKLSDIELRRKSHVLVKKSQARTYIKYAAIISVVIFIGTISIISQRTMSSEDVFNRYYKVYEPAASQRSSQSGTDADYAMALEFFNTHDYGKAAILFNKVVERNPKDMQSTLLNGMSNFENSQYPEAKRSFGKVIDNNNNLYIDQAEWYLAMCYLKTDEKEKAIHQLEAIKNEDGIYKDDAKKILKKLK